MNNVIKANSFAKLYGKALDLVINEPDFICAPRGQKIKECINVTLMLEDPLNNLFNNEIRQFPKKYLANELDLYLRCVNSGEEFGKHAKLWLDITNPDGTVNSAYGHLVFGKKECAWGDKAVSQFDWAYNSLARDQDSRQAIIHYNTPAHQWSRVKDFVCTLHNQFFIRKNKLYMLYYFRSQDLIYGTTSDVPWATVLMQIMYNKLLKVYPDLQLGSLIYTCASLHIYEKFFRKAEAASKIPFFEARLPKVDDFSIPLDYNEDSSFLKWILENK